jgi:small subunit ribosomal protein S5
MNNKKGRAPIREVKEYEEEVIQIDRVTRVVQGGRRLRFRATVVIGNKRGKVGVGVGKSTEVTGAISKAIAQAKKNLIVVPMAGQTIPHPVKVKFKSARIMLMPAIPGTGIKAGGSVRKVIELSGIKDIMGKCFGAPNRLNNSKAAIIALAKLKNLPWLKVKTPANEERPSQNEGNAHRQDGNRNAPRQNNFKKPFTPAPQVKKAPTEAKVEPTEKKPE